MVWLTKTEKAYLAGIIDGEGTVTLTCSNRGQYAQPQVSIANNNLKLIRWIRQRVGFGSIITKKPKKPNHSIAYAWQVNRAGQCKNILKIVYPFLILKRNQAKIVLEQYSTVTPRNGKYSGRMLERKLKLIEKIQKLNRRPN